MKTIITIILLMITTLSFAEKLQGKITDASTKEMLAFANVVILDDSNNIIKGTQTDLEGFYQFADVDLGSYKLKVSMLGYQDVLKEFLIVKGVHFDLFIELDEKEHLLREVVIEGIDSVLLEKKLTKCVLSCGGWLCCGGRYVTTMVYEVEEETIGDQKIEEVAISVYPNPTVNEVFIKIMNGSGNEQSVVRLLSMTGAILEQVLINDVSIVSIDLARYNKGTYIIQYKDGEKLISKRIIKQ